MQIVFFDNYNKSKKRRGNFKNTSKEERAKALDNVICPRCGYQNYNYYVKKYGTCNLCKTTLSKEYFKKTLLRRIKNG